MSRGTKFWGINCPWGKNWMGTVCLEGPINWGPIVGDQMSGDHMHFGTNVNVSRMSPKLLRTYPHIVENLGITMAPLFLRLTS